MSITTRLRWFLVLALLLLVAAASSQGGTTTQAPDSGGNRPSTVVISVRDDGFHWTDAGVGAVAMFAAMLLAAGVALALPRRRDSSDTP